MEDWRRVFGSISIFLLVVVADGVEIDNLDSSEGTGISVKNDFYKNDFLTYGKSNNSSYDENTKLKNDSSLYTEKVGSKNLDPKKAKFSTIPEFYTSEEEREFWDSLYVGEGEEGEEGEEVEEGKEGEEGEEEELNYKSVWEDDLVAERGNSTRRKLAACDYSRGRWQYDSSRRPYTYGCKFIRSSFNCRSNGRKNVGYERYSWNPSNCKQERFSVRYFLPRMRGKTIAIIGDSFGQNFAQSLSCQIAAWTHVRSKSAKIGGVTVRGVEVPAFGIKIFTIGAPFLVQHTSDPKYFGKYKVKYTTKNSYIVWLDKMNSSWKNALVGIDLPIFMSGHWYQLVQGSTLVRAVTLIRNEKIVPYLGQKGYQVALQNVKKFVSRTSGHRGVPMFLTYSPSHYVGATINGARTAVCLNTIPYSPKQQRSFFLKDSSRAFRRIELDSLSGSRFRFLDITFLSSGRPDGHVQRYFGAQSNSKTSWDCTHWCLPGVPDIWTDVLQHVLKTQI